VKPVSRLSDTIGRIQAQEKNGLDPATPVPLSRPAMWLKTISRGCKGLSEGESKGNWGGHTDDDLDTSRMAGVDHVLVLVTTTAFGLELVADDLVVGPPLAALYVFCCWVYLNIAVSCGTN